ncbi:YeiH family protein [Mycobacterium simiae]|uniref:Sulfate exporter family transporter n=1 Tax=Mycobacterium simiae TaxID=1784 RepID=A0A1X0XSV8_MYCSI|nr:putative sulfate exporter family transporter [Mycobacterium simiae]ORJ55949.1 hypothetical protein B5M45_23965 [Mycobacterium simiae]
MISSLGQQHVREATATSSRGQLNPVAVGPGVALCALATAGALAINHWLPTVSPLLIAIVLGAVAANVAPLPRWLRPGLQFSAKRLLRIGVAMLGLQLVLGDILRLGYGVIIVVVSIVALGITGTMFAGKLLGMTWTQRLLIACGFSICGAAAVAAVDGVIQAEDDEDVPTAVALVVICGTLMIPLLPAFAQALRLSDLAAGAWAGGSIHEVAQVIAAAATMGGGALGVAVVVKLARVLMLAPVMAVLSVRQRRIAGTGTDIKRPPLVPLFVLAFMVCVALRSADVVPPHLLQYAKVIQVALLTAAMFALGTGVHASVLKKVGPRPFVLAVVSTVWIATVALTGVMLASH